ncbi:MAG: PKD domain-containing protein [Bacteroidetes bacterium]|nr:PKD domain-containing protein [Bacteroidota bacterium]
MNKQSALLMCFLLFIQVLFPLNKAYTFHTMALDITYTCSNDSVYTFELHYYRNCYGGAAPSTISISLNSSSCGISTTLTLSVLNTVEVSELCTSQLPNSVCSGGTLFGVEKTTYSGTATLKFCNDWIISFSTCCRDGNIDNIVSAGTTSLYVQTTLDNSSGTCNNSVQFTSTSVPFFCSNQCFKYHNGAYDPDGDSLVFTLVDAALSSSNPVSYKPVFSATYPFDTTGGGFIAFDNNTGLLNVCPKITGQYVVAIKIDEFRNDTLIASTTQELHFFIQACSNQQPTVSNIKNSLGGLQIDPSIFGVCAGDTFSFQVIGNDVNTGDTLTMLTNIAKAIPGATFTILGINPDTGTITWATSISDTGIYYFTVEIEDDSCDFKGSVYNAFVIMVGNKQPVSNFGYNVSGSTVNFSDSSKNAITWLWDFGDGNTGTGQNTTHTYNTSGTYNVCLIAVNSCASDTICKSVTVLTTEIARKELPLNISPIKIFPNPCSTYITVILPGGYQNLNNPSFVIHDLLGKEVKRIKNIKTDYFILETNDLKRGLYIYKLVGKEGLHNTGKLVIQ